jgi:hypothetical protein
MDGCQGLYHPVTHALEDEMLKPIRIVIQKNIYLEKKIIADDED